MTDALDGSTPRSPPGPPPAPPFIPGEVIGVALAVWSRHALAFTAVALVVQVPALALELRRGPGGDAASAWGLLFFGSFVGLVSEGAITLGVLQALRGERPRVGAMLAVGAKRLWLLFTVSFTYGISVLGGLFLLVVPGLLALAAGYLAIPAAVAEPGLGMEGALRRSWALTSGRRLPLLAVVLFFQGIALLAAVGASSSRAVAALPYPAAVGANALLGATLTGLASAGAAVAYRDLRRAREGEAPPGSSVRWGSR